MVKHFDDANFDSEIASGVTLVDFYADWCGPCKMMSPIIDALSTELEGQVKIGKLDIEKAQKTTATFNVMSIPTVIVFKNGKEVNRVVGLRDKDTLKKMLMAVV